jgi:hypothetical protein
MFLCVCVCAGSGRLSPHTSADRALSALFRSSQPTLALASLPLTGPEILALARALQTVKHLTEMDWENVEVSGGGGAGAGAGLSMSMTGAGSALSSGGYGGGGGHHHHSSGGVVPVGSGGGGPSGAPIPGGLRPMLRAIANNDSLNANLQRVRWDYIRHYIFDDLVGALHNKTALHTLSLRGLAEGYAVHTAKLLSKPFGAALRCLDLTGTVFERNDMFALEKALSHNPATMASPPFSSLQQLALPVRAQTGLAAAHVIHACPYLQHLELRTTDIPALTLCVRRLYTAPARHLRHLYLSFEYERVELGTADGVLGGLIGSTTRARWNEDLSHALCTLLRSQHVWLATLVVCDLGPAVDADFFEAMKGHRSLTTVSVSDTMILDSVALELMEEALTAKSNALAPPPPAPPLPSRPLPSSSNRVVCIDLESARVFKS